jgi:hypothetical protein
MNAQQAATILRVLRSVWPDTKADESTVKAWTWAFEDVPYPAVEDAVKRWIRTGTFSPKPGELLRTIGVNAVGPDLIPEVAWSEVISQASSVGHRGRPSWSHPLIGQAVDAIGWRSICLSDEKDLGFLRNQFVKTLTALMNRAVERVQIEQGPMLGPSRERSTSQLPERVLE